MDRIGRYEVLEVLGRGGMGDVYRARDTRLERDIALKILPAEVARNPERRSRFLREAKTVAALSHPNIVTVHSVEEDGDSLFITMELVRGKTLQSVIPKAGIPLETFFGLAVPLADAVSYAHRKGITHRDLKPGNIMIDDEGRLKVLDFGLAKLLVSDDPDQAATLLAESATGEGIILGTAAYMSPEQAEGKVVDHRSDIFSLGIVLYEMATGRRPFKGDTKMSTISSILREEADPVTALRPDLPHHLGRIIKKCLQKNPGRRYQSGVDLRNDLQELHDELSTGELEATGQSRPQPLRRRFRPIPMLLGAAALSLIVFTALRVLHRPGDTGGPGAPSPAQIPVTSTGDVRRASLSPDGSYIAFTVRKGNRMSLRVKQVATGSEVEVLPFADQWLYDVHVSPDGQYVFYGLGEPGASSHARSDIYQVPLLGGTSRRVLEGAAGDFALSPDGDRIAYYIPDGDADALVVAGSDGSGPRKVGSVSKLTDLVLAWSGDGKRILTTERSENIVALGDVLAVIDADSGDRVESGSVVWTYIQGLAWHPDGTILVAGVPGKQRFQDTSQLWLLASLGATPERLFSDLSDYYSVDLDASGDVLTAVTGKWDQSIWVVTDGRKRKIDYTSLVGPWLMPLAWTRDGRILVEHREGEEMHIRALSADGTRSALLTTEGPFNMGPAVSPAGDAIAFFSNRSGDMRIYLCDNTGNNVHRLTDEDVGEFFPAFDPGGETIYYQSSGETGKSWETRRVPSHGGRSTRVVEGFIWPRVSPDGTRLLLAPASPDCDPCNFILPIDGGTPASIDRAGFQPLAWYPDGSAVTSTHQEDDTDSLWKVPLDGSEPTELMDFPGETIWAAAWNASGDSLATVTRNVSRDVILVRGLKGRFGGGGT